MKLSPIDKRRFLIKMELMKDAYSSDINVKDVLTKEEIGLIVDEEYKRLDETSVAQCQSRRPSPEECAGMVYTVLKRHGIKFLNNRKHPVLLSDQGFQTITDIERRKVKQLDKSDLYKPIPTYKEKSRDLLKDVEESVLRRLGLKQ